MAWVPIRVQSVCVLGGRKARIASGLVVAPVVVLCAFARLGLPQALPLLRWRQPIDKMRRDVPMRVLLLCCKGFETMELSPFVDVMGWARDDFGHDVEVELCGFAPTVTSTFGVPVAMGSLVDDVHPGAYDALAVPGGFEEYGFYEEAYDERVLGLIRAFDAACKPIASVCVGALPLGKSGILTGRCATTYHLGDGLRQRQLASFGAQVVNEPVVVDGNVVTSWCPQTAPFVAFALLAKLTSRDAAHEVMRAMGFPCNG